MHDERGNLRVVTLKDPKSRNMGGFVPGCQYRGVAAPALSYSAFSRVMVKLTAEWLDIPGVGYPKDSGVVATESIIESALEAFAALTEILGFDLDIEKFGRGIALEFLRASVCFHVARKGCRAHLSLSAARVGK